MKSVEELDVFKLAHEMALKIYTMTQSFPDEERYGLSSQMRRAAYSVPSNLAEGAGRINQKEYKHFVGIARGSAAELRYQLLLAKDLGYLDQEEYVLIQSNYDRVSRMLTALAKALT
ncbi:MAG: four helix bundle protein [Desulfobacteraceae bacterium]|jgi:four helix bundle protein